MSVLGLIGDALWVIGLTVMVAMSREAMRRTAAGTPFPMPLPNWRAPRNLALWAFPLFAFGVSLILLVAGHRPSDDPNYPLMVFGVRATLPALFAYAHLTWVRAGLATLEAEGALKS